MHDVAMYMYMYVKSAGFCGILKFSEGQILITKEVWDIVLMYVASMFKVFVGILKNIQSWSLAST